MSAKHLGLSPENYLEYAHRIAGAIEPKATEHNWLLRFVHQFVAFRLDEDADMVSSLAIWFYAGAPTPTSAMVSRNLLIEELRSVVSQDVG
jgi:hypothetical protein